MDREVIKISCIELEWSNWIPWDELKKDARRKGVIRLTNKKSGVYEAKYRNQEERLTIGKASDLRMRVK